MNNTKENKDKTILVVDDMVSILLHREVFIEHLGYNVLLASSGHEALKVVEEHDGKLDLLLTDIMMPNMNGLELAETVVADNPDVKVLFMSGYLQSAFDSRNTLSFKKSFIQKPFSFKTLTTHIKKALNEIN